MKELAARLMSKPVLAAALAYAVLSAGLLLAGVPYYVATGLPTGVAVAVAAYVRSRIQRAHGTSHLMSPQRFTETTTKRVAYALTVAWMLMVGVGLLNHAFALTAAAFGYPAGIWMGRLTEAREAQKGNGVILDP